MQLRDIHRASAMVIGTFVTAHIINHLLGLVSISTHLSTMDMLRRVYRHPIAEAVLLASVAVQMTTGVTLVFRGWRGRSGAVAWSQALSGVYLSMFLAVHVSAVLYGRWQLGLDTNFYFAAAGLHVAPYGWFFAPYYGLAVWSLFTHLGCAWFWHFHGSQPRRARTGWYVGIGLGALVGVLLVALMAGWLNAVSIPANYLATYRS